MTDDPSPPSADSTALATFGGGCFWCTEAVFREVGGVLDVVSGYAGGAVEDPGYEEVCSGRSGHAEVVQIRFDPKRVSYVALLEVFFRTHDPTTLNRQGADFGTQYRSIVLYHTHAQRKAAEAAKAALDEAGVFPRAVVTEIVPFDRFYAAEADHQDYYRLNPQAFYCRAVIVPKLEKFRRVFGGLRALTLLLLFLAVGIGAAAPSVEADGRKDAQPVIVLGAAQLFEGLEAYPAFCEAEARTPRSRLRGETVAKLKSLAKREQPALLEALGSPKDARPLWIVNAVLVRLTPEEQKAALASEAVKYVYPAGAVPSDDKPGKVKHVLPKRRRRRAFKTRGKQIPWNLQALRVPEAWESFEVTGEGVVVAMFDSGITYRHEDLERNVWINPDEKPNNGRDDDRNGLVDDLYGYDFGSGKADVSDRHPKRHGTLTSSVVAGDGTGGTITGVAPRARLMSLVAWGGVWLAARALQYAIEEGADVVNMSFSKPGLGHTRGLWRWMAEHATAAGLVLVSGAGNFGRTARVPEQIRIPEGIPCVVCAGGVTRDLKVPPSLSRGPVEWGSVIFFEDHPLPGGLVKPDVCAFPGPGIALVKPGKSGYLPEDNGRFGNSLSSPHVAGVVALLLDAAPELTPWRVREILEATAKDLEGEGKDVTTGAGLVDAYRAVEAALE